MKDKAPIVIIIALVAILATSQRKPAPIVDAPVEAVETIPDTTAAPDDTTEPVAEPEPQRPYILYFTASWCGPCARMKPSIEAMKAEGYDIRTASYDNPAHRQYFTKYRVRSFPTFVVLKDGKEVSRVSGYQTKDAIRGMAK